MKQPSIQQALKMGVLIVAWAIVACNPNCDWEPAPPLCEIDIVPRDVLMVADFERGDNPTNLCGSMGAWGYPAGGVQVESSYSSLLPRVDTGHFVGAISLVGVERRPGDSVTWKGGGLTLALAGEEGLDVRAYDSLVFYLRTPDVDQLKYTTTLRLKDVHKHKGPQRMIQQFGAVSTVWTRIAIPLDTLCYAALIDPYDTPDVDPAQVVSLETVTTHTGTEPLPSDGTLFIDNIQLVRK